MAGSDEEGATYTATIFVFKNSPGGKYSHKFVGEVCPIDVAHTEEAAEAGYCMVLTDHTMKKVFTEVEGRRDKKFMFNVRVELIKVESQAEVVEEVEVVGAGPGVQAPQNQEVEAPLEQEVVAEAYEVPSPRGAPTPPPSFPSIARTNQGLRNVRPTDETTDRMRQRLMRQMSPVHEPPRRLRLEPSGARLRQELLIPRNEPRSAQPVAQRVRVLPYGASSGPTGRQLHRAHPIGSPIESLEPQFEFLNAMEIFRRNREEVTREPTRRLGEGPRAALRRRPVGNPDMGRAGASAAAASGSTVELPNSIINNIINSLGSSRFGAEAENEAASDLLGSSSSSSSEDEEDLVVGVARNRPRNMSSDEDFDPSIIDETRRNQGEARRFQRIAVAANHSSSGGEEDLEIEEVVVEQSEVEDDDQIEVVDNDEQVEEDDIEVGDAGQLFNQIEEALNEDEWSVQGGGLCQLCRAREEGGMIVHREECPEVQGGEGQEVVNVIE